MLRFPHFADNSQRPDEGVDYDRIWKLRTVFDKLNEAYANFCNPLNHLAMDEVTVKFRPGLSSDTTFQRKENVSASNLQTL
jgi:type IV secretory pathway VirB9-like protein